MKTEELKKAILMNHGDRKFYGYEVCKSTKPKIELSRLYRILGDMTREQLLEIHWEKSPRGPKRKVYQISNKGRQELNRILLESIDIVHRFYEKYIENLPPHINVFESYARLAAEKTQEHSRIGYITRRNSPMHEGILATLRKKTAQGELYLIKPESIEVTISDRIEGLIIFSGDLDNISLKNEYLDLLVVVDLPSRSQCTEAIGELHRVLKRGGRLFLLVPTILVAKCRDPLTLGDFIEICEHQYVSRSDRIDKNSLIKDMKRYFGQIKKTRISYMTVFLATKPV